MACASTGEPVQNSATEPRRIEAGSPPLTQTFVPRGARVGRLTVWTATYGHPSPQATLVLELEGAGTRRTARVAGPAIADNARTTFAFPPVPRAAGRSFTATFRATGTDPVGLYVNPHDPYPEGTLRPGPGDLAFEVGHADRVGGAVAALARTTREAAGRIGADPLFAGVWALGLAAAAALALAPGRRPDRRLGLKPGGPDRPDDG